MQKILLLTFLSLFTCLNEAQTQNALSFDGSNDYISTSFAPPTGNAARTFEAYIKTTANAVPNAGGIQQVILDQGSFVTGGRFTFNVLWNNAIRLEVGGNGVSGTIAVNDGNWHHVVAVYDPNNSAGTVRLYVDGNLDTQGTPTVAVNTQPGNFVIGRRVDGVNSFTGEIDEVRVWDVALTQNDIITAGGSEICPTSTGLQAYFQFDEGNAASSNTGLTNLPELVNGNDGTLQNFTLSGASSNWIAGAPINTFINTDVTLSNNVLTAASGAASYQWIDCNTGMPIAGETGTSFSPSVNGDYAVEITDLGCTQQSDCINISTLNNDSLKLTDLKIVRNPGSHIVFNTTDIEAQATITHLSGKSLFTGSLKQIEENSVALSSGLYLINIKKNEVTIKTIKWIKE